MRTVLIITLAFLFFPSFANASVININLADATTLESLVGIGPSKAVSIINYRKNHGVFASIEAIQNVNGIGKSIYAKIKTFITVGSVNTASTNSASVSNAPSITHEQNTSTKKAETYVPPPSSLSIKIHGAPSALLEVPVTFSARVLTKKGVVDSSVQIVWGFGDGSSTVGSSVTKNYHYTGTYLVTATAKDGTTSAYGDTIVNVTEALALISNVSYKGVTIENNSDKRLDLSGWWILAGNGRFRIPNGTVLLPRAPVLFPFLIMNMPISFSATLTYPDGLYVSSYSKKKPAQLVKRKSAKPVSIAVVAMPSHVVQPIAVKKRSNKRQVVAIINHKKNIHLNAKESYAPTDAKNLASVGAALPSVTVPSFASTSLPTDTSNTPAKSSSGILNSVWTTGLLGVIILAGSAFILL